MKTGLREATCFYFPSDAKNDTAKYRKYIARKLLTTVKNHFFQEFFRRSGNFCKTIVFTIRTYLGNLSIKYILRQSHRGI
jgi:uncharacterized protein YaaW (UPF0174 family)